MSAHSSTTAAKGAVPFCQDSAWLEEHAARPSARLKGEGAQWGPLKIRVDPVEDGWLRRFAIASMPVHRCMPGPATVVASGHVTWREYRIYAIPIIPFDIEEGSALSSRVHL